MAVRTAANIYSESEAASGRAGVFECGWRSGITKQKAVGTVEGTEEVNTVVVMEREAEGN